MKNSLSFLLTLFSLIFVTNLALGNYVEQQKKAYENYETYISNNVSAKYNIKSLAENIESKNNIIATENNKIFYSNFTKIILSSGRIPINDQEYISSNNTSDMNSVGTFLPNLDTSNYKQIFKYPEVGKLIVLKIEFQESPTINDQRLLKTQGFIKVDNENINKLLGVETYKLISVVMNIFFTVLIIISVVYLFTGTLEYLVKYRKKFEVFRSLGADSGEVAKSFIKLHQKSFIFSLVVSFTILSVIASLSKILLNNFSISDFIYCYVFLFLCFTIVIIYYYIVVRIYYTAKIVSRKNKQGSISIFIVIALMTSLLLMLYDNKISILLLLLLTIYLIGVPRTFFIKTIFETKKAYIISIITVISLLLLVAGIIISIPLNVIDKQENTINTTIISNSVFMLNEGETSSSLLTKIEDQKYYSINPNDGMSHHDKKYYPLIKSTKLDYFNTYVISGNKLNDESIAIGHSLSISTGISVGDKIMLNGKEKTVTNILNSNEYSGQIIYMSNKQFSEIYGETGNTYYISTEDENTLTNSGYKLKYYMDKSKFKNYYQNSVKEVMIIPIILLLILMLCGTSIIYYILKLLVTNSLTNINIARSLGMLKKDYLKQIQLFLWSIGISAISLAVVVSIFFIEQLQKLILDVSGSFVNLSIRWEIFGTWIFILGIVIFMLSSRTYKIIISKSIYEQYKLTESGEL